MKIALTIVLIVLLPGVLWAQEVPGKQQPRRTPLGVQVPKLPEPKSREPKAAKDAPGKAAPPAGPVEPVGQLLQRAAAEHNASLLPQRSESVAEGTLTFFRIDGETSTYPVTLLQKGPNKVQRIIKQPAGELRQGSDGTKTWNSFGAFMPTAAGAPLHFIESQTSRSVRNLFEEKPGRAVRDGGSKGEGRVIQMEDQGQKKTGYVLDPVTARVSRLEFVVGESRNPFNGESVPIVETFQFSDFRKVDGVLTPFRIERYLSGIKTEEMQFRSVRYNTGVGDEFFRP